MKPKSMILLIRPAEIADLDAMIALSKRTIRASYTSFLGEKAVQDHLTSGAVEDYFQESMPRCLVIEEKEKNIEPVRASVAARGWPWT